MLVDKHGVDTVEAPQHQRVHDQHVAARKATAELRGEALTAQPSRSRDRGKHDIGHSTRTAGHRDCDGTDPERCQGHALRVGLDDTVGERPRSWFPVERRNVRMPRPGIQARLDAFPYRPARARLSE